MIPYGTGEFRSRRRPKKYNGLISIIVLVAIVGGLAFIALRARSRHSSPDDLYAAAALGVAGIGFVCFQVSVQGWIDRLQHRRNNARERQFWRDRQARERRQYTEQERLDHEATERRAARRAALKGVLEGNDPQGTGKPEE